jgi:ABC-type Zn uptake system ZnuABC Zn-binding protein ZnuA
MLTAVLPTLIGCSAPVPADPRPTVVVTIFPVADLVAVVAGDAIRVESLLPVGASPATWEATPGQVRTLSNAAGYIRVGGGLDGWLEGFGPEATHIALTDGMELLDSHHESTAAHGATESDDPESGDPESGDPHVWLDPILVRDAFVPRIQSFLTKLFPDDAVGFADRAGILADTLTLLDAQLRSILESAPKKSFVATHDAWSYFAARYGLQPLGSIYERPGHEPSVRGMAYLIRAARADGITVILAEPQLAEGGARALAAEMGASIAIVDPLGGPGIPGRESYTSMMRANARDFARAMGAR